MSEGNVPFPLTGPDAGELVKVFQNLRDYICIHQPVFDEYGSVIDARFVWWNDAYRQVRTKPVEYGASMGDTYFAPEGAVGYVRQAWTDGYAYQLFELEPTTRDRYRPEGAHVLLSVDWQRLGDYVVEVGSDLSEYVALKARLQDQESLIAVSNRERVLAIERERIARNLHDTVIQRLYATSLRLTAAMQSVGPIEAQWLSEVSNTIQQTITQIREEIFDVTDRSRGTLHVQLENVLAPVVSTSTVAVEIVAYIDAVSDDIAEYLRATVTEAVSNAVRHSGGTKVVVTVDRQNEYLVATVADNGRGISDESKLGNGLVNMRKRATDLGGECKVESEVGHGTTIIWRVPVPEWWM